MYSKRGFIAAKKLFCESEATSNNSSSVMPMSLRVLGYVFGVYSSRSRDSEGPYAERNAPGCGKSSAKVSFFVL